MPTYEYECKKCNRRFELFQRMSDEPLKKCSRCRGPVRRLIGMGGGVIYKGGGFHTTEYRSEEYKRREKEEKSGSSGSSSKSSCGSCSSKACSTCKK